MVYQIVFEKAEEGGFLVYCPALKGCRSEGETIEEAEENIKDAIGLYLETQAELMAGKLVKEVEVLV